MALRRRTLLAALPLTALAACSDQSADTNRVNEINRDRYVSGDGSNYRWEEPDERPEAPVITGESLTGESLDTAEWAGSIIVMNFWGSWCPPCRSEAEYLVEAAAHFEFDDVQFVGVNIRDTVDAAQAFEQRYGITYPSFNDAGGAIALQFVEYDISPTNIPATFIIDAEHRVFSVWREDFKDTETLIADINKVLEQ
ncbi:TlpA family protein disulfide reductase [Glycomyces sp. L485]|uniref:TlpA family protein disulfide reductase n=1 Tax=Glycomyces sp. L485 TaxID=2909235 RepID=UPI001F4B9C03|nr:TlpA disulfide reductase family protein [Glycomyces sp. L485]MCH7233023.1 TlpA family protein disulfide reductase [Glycomyces sp. L485]